MAGGRLGAGALSLPRGEDRGSGGARLVAPPSPLSFNHLLYRDPGYEPTKFAPTTLLAKIPNVLVVRKGLPASPLQELIAYAKANPGKLSSPLGETAEGLRDTYGSM